MDLAKPITQIPQALLVPTAVSALTSPDAGGFERGGFSDILRERMSVRERSLGTHEQTFAQTEARPTREMPWRIENDAVARESDRSVSGNSRSEEYGSRADSPVAVKSCVQDEEGTPGGVDAKAVDTEVANAKSAGSEVVADESQASYPGQDAGNSVGSTAPPAEDVVVVVLDSVMAGMLVMPGQGDALTPVAEDKNSDAVADNALLSGAVVIPVWIEQSLAVPQPVSGEPVTDLIGGDEVADMGRLLAVVGKNLLRNVLQGESTTIAATTQFADAPDVSVATTAAQQAAFVSALVASVQKPAVSVTEVAILQSGVTDDGLVPSLESISSLGGITVKGAALPLVAPAQPMTAQQSVMQAGLIAEKLAAQIVWMQSQHVQRADINLNPAELGQLQIRLDIQRDQANVNVSSPHAHVREWLDAGQSRLRDLLGQTGVELASYSVSDSLSQQSDSQQRRQPQDSSGVASGLLSVDEIELDEEGGSPLRMGVGLVDSYA